MNNSTNQSNLPSPTVNFVYRCTHSFTHPNLGRMLTKGNLYIVTDINTHGTIQVSGKSNGCACDEDFFHKHFEEVMTSDSPKARKMYVDATVRQLMNKVDITFYRTKCNCANEIIDKFYQQMKSRWGC